MKGESSEVDGDEQADSPILCQVERAKALYGLYADRLTADEDIRTLLDRYRASIEQTGVAMHREGIGAACSTCARQNPSGCCFSGIEDGYDDILLLLNMLLGCALPESREQPDSCFFVGERGCRLMARFYFCLHYFCPGLTTSLGDARIGALQQQVAQEIHAGCQVEAAVRRWLRGRSVTV